MTQQQGPGDNDRVPTIVASSDPTIGNDPIIRQAGGLPWLPPLERRRTRCEQDRNLLVNDSRVLVLNTGGEMCLTRAGAAAGGGWRGGWGNLRRLVAAHPALHDPQAPTVGRDQATDFVTPPTEQGKRVRYDIKEYDPLLDSANSDFSDWTRMAEDIHETYDKYDGFVILHGTDTLAYTASGLSFMFEQLGKTVILTGSLIPLCEARSDGLANLVDSLVIAGNYVLPEVCVYFGQRLYRGNRVKKSDSESTAAFSSPSGPLLGTGGTTVEIRWKSVRRPGGDSPFRIIPALCPDVAVLHLFPGITAATVRAALAPPVRGVVMRLYGQGNAPVVRHDLLGIIKAADRDRDVVVVGTTQCQTGTILADTECGRALQRVGVTFCADLTLECAVAKLAHLLGRQIPAAEVKRLMGRSLRGELTMPVADRFSVRSDDFLLRLSGMMGLTEQAEVEELRNYLNSVVMCNAAQTGDVESLRKLVDGDTGWQVDVQDYDSHTPLHIAAAEGHVEVVEYLLAKGARVHIKDRSGRTPLVEAVMSLNGEAAGSIARAGGTLGLDDITLAQHLNRAVYNSQVEQLQMFLRAGANPCVGDYSRTTPLSLAVQLGNIEMVRVLLATGKCDVQQRDWWGCTPLEVAREAQSRSTQPQCYVYDSIADLLTRYAAEHESDANLSPDCPRPAADGAVGVGIAVPMGVDAGSPSNAGELSTGDTIDT